MTDTPTGIAFEDARQILADVATRHRLPVERLALARCHGRVLAEDIAAPIALQPFDNSAMDGYACRHADLREHDAVALTLVGEQFAGRALGLRVVARDGAPLGWMPAIVRNLLRTVDMLPFGYALGLVTCLWAGVVVVRDARGTGLRRGRRGRRGRGPAAR